MESELIQTNKQPRPQKPSSTQKQFKDQEIDHFPQENNFQSNPEELTKEQQGLLQEFREKVNPILRIIKIITSSCQLWKSQIEFH